MFLFGINIPYPVVSLLHLPLDCSFGGLNESFV
jgi:hypothetical protein